MKRRYAYTTIVISMCVVALGAWQHAGSATTVVPRASDPTGIPARAYDNASVTDFPEADTSYVERVSADGASDNYQQWDEQATAPLALRERSDDSAEVRPVRMRSYAEMINLTAFSSDYGGVNEIASGNIKVGVSIGEPAVGEITAGNLKVGLGSWFEDGMETGDPCLCVCHADPECDGVINVFDVVYVTDVAFRGATPITDSSALCLFATTDVNCDTLTDVLDIVRIINVAFRGADPGAEFCDASACQTHEIPIPAVAEGSVVVESKSFLSGQSACTLGVFIANDIPLTGLVIPLEVRTHSGSVFYFGNVTNTVFNFTSNGRLKNSPLSDVSGPAWPAASVTRRTYADPEAVSCSGPTSSSYSVLSARGDTLSPDGFLLATVSTGDPGIGEAITLAPGSDGLTPSLRFVLNLLGADGCLVIDTSCVTPANHLIGVDASSNSVRLAFTPGFITVGAGSCEPVQNVPPVANCHDVQVDPGEGCYAAVDAAQVGSGSYDFEDGTNITFTLLPAGPFPAGTTSALLIVTDQQGASDTCGASITVLDTIRPSIACPPDTTMACDSFPPQAVKVVAEFNDGWPYGEPIVWDNCDTTFEVSLFVASSQGTFPCGILLQIGYWALDRSGNASDTCFQFVEIVDTMPPIVTCQSDTTVAVPSGVSGASVSFSATAVDNCDPSVELFAVPPSGAEFAIGQTLVSCYARDACGNISDTCYFVVLVVDTAHMYPPVAQCQDRVVPADAYCQGNVSVDNGSFDPDGGTITIAQMPNGPYTLGVTSVTLVVTDDEGERDTCFAAVTVVDATAPVVYCPMDTTIVVPSGTTNATVFYGIAGAVDACDPSPSIISVPASGSTFPIGTSEVVAVATDNTGNSDSCSFLIVVTDTMLPDQPPVAICRDVQVSADSSCWAFALIDDGSYDPDGGAVIVEQTPPGPYSAGTTAVSIRVLDDEGNVSYCESFVTVVDDMPPFVLCWQADTLIAVPHGTTAVMVEYSTPSATDNCSEPTIVCNIPSGSEFPIGITPVECVAGDPSGNTDTCAFVVIVEEEMACPCPCQADPICDGITDVLDVISIINIAFRGYGAPSADTCALTGDVNCDGSASDVIDVVLMVNVAFRGGNVSTLCVPVGAPQCVPVMVAPTPSTGGHVIVESRHFEVSQTTPTCSVGVFIGNDVPIQAIVLPLELRSIDGAYPITTGFFFGPMAAGRVQQSALGSGYFPTDCNDDFDPSDCVRVPASRTLSRYPNPAANSCSGPTSNSYTTSGAFNAVSPDGVFYASVSQGVAPQEIFLQPGADDPNNRATASFQFRFQTNAINGCFEIDTCCITPANHLVFVDANLEPIIPSFTKGQISVGTGECIVPTNQAPTANCQDVQVGVDANCQGTATVAQVNDGSNDPEDSTNLSLALEPAGPYPLGQNNVQLIVTDQGGLSDTCIAVITVVDQTPPTVACTQRDTTVFVALGTGTAVVDYSLPLVSDNCPGFTTSCSHPSGADFPLGTTLVTCTATDATGNADSCFFAVTIAVDPCNPDTLPPTIICRADTTVQIRSGDTAAVVYYSVPGASDNCSVVTVNCTPSPGSLFQRGQTVVTCVAADAAGNTDTCSFTVYVRDFVLSGNAVLVESKTFVASQVACTIGVYVSNDVPIVGMVIPLEIRTASGGAFYFGNLVNTVWNYNPNGRIYNSPLGPVSGAHWPAANVTRRQYADPTTPNLCGGPVTSTFSTASARGDSVSPDGFMIAMVTTGDPGIGDEVVLAPGTDSDGNASFRFVLDLLPLAGEMIVDTCCVTPANHLYYADENISEVRPYFQSGIITVLGSQTPIARCKETITLSADHGCLASVTPQVLDSGSIDPDGDPLTYSLNPPGPFGLGEHSVWLVVSDGQYDDSCASSVIVVDRTPPVITCPGDMNVEAPYGASGTIVNYNLYVWDNCGMPTITCSRPSGSFFWLDSTILVTCVATDAAGFADTCGFHVTVVPSNPAPELNWTNPAEPRPGVEPDAGPLGATFEFSVVYSDLNNDPPMMGYPQVRVDYEGNGSLSDPKDGIYPMWATGGPDYVTGRTYVYRTVLPAGNSYRFNFAAKDEPGKDAGGPASGVWIDAPDVSSDAVDLFLYASDILFSNDAPEAGETFYASAKVHNNSSTTFTSLPVAVSDKYGPVGVLTLATLPAFSTATVVQECRYDVPGYYTVRFMIDPDSLIAEWNETNNSAARGLTIGDPVMPGSIVVSASVPTPVEAGAFTTVSGRADYYEGTDSLEQVAGGEVKVTVGPYGPYAGSTGSSGAFSVSFAAPAVPGDYDVKVTVTDFSLSANAHLPMTVLSCLGQAPDLTCNFNLSHTPRIVNLDDTTTITKLYVLNLCSDTARDFWVHLIQDGSSIDSVFIPVLGPFQIDTVAAWQGLELQFVGEGYHSVSCHVDRRNSVEEVSELNNQCLMEFLLWCDHPDLSPTADRPQPVTFAGQAQFHYARIYNLGGVPIPSLIDSSIAPEFEARFRISNATWSTEQRVHGAVEAFGVYKTVYASLTVPSPGTYEMSITADPGGIIPECREDNNSVSWTLYVQDVRPNLKVNYEDVGVRSQDLGANTDGSQVYLQAVVHNVGAAAAQNVQVVFAIDGVPFGDTALISTIAPLSTGTAFSSEPWAVNRQACAIEATADPANLISETNEMDNRNSVPAVIELVPAYGGTCAQSSWPTTWPLSDVCTAVLGQPVTLYARAYTAAAFNVPQSIVVNFRDSVEGDLGTSELSTLINHGRLQFGSSQLPVDSISHVFTVPGWHKIMVSIDADDAFHECDEDNTFAAYFWVGALPDLRVPPGAFDVKPLNPSPGDPVQLSADVYNEGSSVARNVQVRFEVDGVQIGALRTIDSIPPRTTSGENYVGVAAGDTWIATDLPTNLHMGGVVVDPANLVEELSDTNNTTTRAIIVGSAPDLTLSCDDVAYFNYHWGMRADHPALIQSTIHNDGDQPAACVVRYFYTQNQDSIPIGEVPIPIINPGTSISTSVGWAIADTNTHIVVSIEDVSPYDFDASNNAVACGFHLILRGDCSRDGVIDVVDVVCLIGVVFRNETPRDPWEVDDTNCDGVLDVRDVVRLIDFAFRAGVPPCEFVAP